MSDMSTYETDSSVIFSLIMIAPLVVMAGHIAYVKACELITDDNKHENEFLYQEIAKLDEEVIALNKKLKVYEDLACQMLDHKAGINGTQG